MATREINPCGVFLISKTLSRLNAVYIPLKKVTKTLNADINDLFEEEEESKENRHFQS